MASFTRQFLVLLASLLATVSLALAVEAEDLPHYGLTVSEIRAEAAKAKDNVLWAYLGATNGFAPNVNTRVQPFTGSLEEYMKLSYDQFDQLFGKNQWQTVSEEQPSDHELNSHVTASKDGKDFHFYFRVLQTKRDVVLITATALKKQWPSAKRALEPYVNSFQFDEEDAAPEPEPEARPKPAPKGRPEGSSKTMEKSLDKN